MLSKVMLKKIKQNIDLMAKMWAETYADQMKVDSARPSQGMRSLYPLETPSMGLLKILVKPENRTILVEFVRRHDREFFFKTSLNTVIKQREEELFTHFEEVDDFAHYVQAIKHEDDLWTYIMNYLPEENLPQKNHDDFVTLTKGLRQYAGTMKDPSAYAIEALHEKGVITTREAVDLIESAFLMMHAGISSNKKATKHFKVELSKAYKASIAPLHALRQELVSSSSRPAAPTQALCVTSPQVTLSPSPGLPNATNASPVNAPVSPYIPSKGFNPQ